MPKLTQRVLKALLTNEMGSEVEVPAAELRVGPSGRARERLSWPESSMRKGLEACDGRGSGLQGQDRSPVWPEWKVHERVGRDEAGWWAGSEGQGSRAEVRSGFLLRTVGTHEGLIQGWHAGAVRCSEGYGVREGTGRLVGRLWSVPTQVSFPTRCDHQPRRGDC